MFAICNNSGSIWHTFDVVVPISPGVNASTVVCNVTGGVFGACLVSTIGNFVDIFFPSNGNLNCNGDNCGIPNNHFLIVDFNDPCPVESEEECTPSGTWPAGSLLTFNPNGTQGSAIAFAPVPEPTSLLLLGSGLVAVWQFRRRRR